MSNFKVDKQQAREVKEAPSQPELGEHFQILADLNNDGEMDSITYSDYTLFAHIYTGFDAYFGKTYSDKILYYTENRFPGFYKKTDYIYAAHAQDVDGDGDIDVVAQRFYIYDGAFKKTKNIQTIVIRNLFVENNPPKDPEPQDQTLEGCIQMCVDKFGSK